MNEIYAISRDSTARKSRKELADVKKMLNALQETFGNFSHSHFKCLSILQETDSEYISGISYGKNLERKVHDCINFVNAWLGVDHIKPEDSISHVESLCKQRFKI